MQTTPEPSSSRLKRSRSATQEPMDDELPEVPKLTGQIILEVFTHRSLRLACDARFRDNERLTVLGQQVLDMITTQLLFFRKPNLKVQDIRTQKRMLLADDTIDIWSKLYRMRDELRCDPQFLPKLEMPEQGRLLFHAYLGAVFEQHGLNVVQEWIGALLRLSTNLLDNNEMSELGPRATQTAQPTKRIKLEDTSTMMQTTPTASASTTHYNPYAQPALPPGPPPPRPPSPPRSLPNPLAPAQPNIAFLPLFNQTAVHRGVAVNYMATFSGPPHAGLWTISCVVNGIEKGKGTAASKQLAKEQAARVAYYAMGWAPRESLRVCHPPSDVTSTRLPQGARVRILAWCKPFIGEEATLWCVLMRVLLGQIPTTVSPENMAVCARGALL
ncbi:hypothetical protein BV22DRAFT_1139526 [Leucogyrophana mollusca]|uniref:Uncharacterized protein n=1 Tax=Leucogyrophana mollusca TaxID=85980 RepID=A0ACB8BY80_9AGAM|nr:hypothetical protein BV22DRAFT_1139526 [Leucogyrophana mollusca]